MDILKCQQPWQISEYNLQISPEFSRLYSWAFALLRWALNEPAAAAEGWKVVAKFIPEGCSESKVSTIFYNPKRFQKIPKDSKRFQNPLEDLGSMVPALSKC